MLIQMQPRAKIFRDNGEIIDGDFKEIELGEDSAEGAEEELDDITDELLGPEETDEYGYEEPEDDSEE